MYAHPAIRDKNLNVQRGKKSMWFGCKKNEDEKKRKKKKSRINAKIALAKWTKKNTLNRDWSRTELSLRTGDKHYNSNSWYEQISCRQTLSEWVLLAKAYVPFPCSWSMSANMRLPKLFLVSYSQSLSLICWKAEVFAHCEKLNIKISCI